MIIHLLIGLAVIVVVFVVIVALRPADFRVTRKATISAPANNVFAQVNDFHQWAAWSPWENIDPALQRTFEGPSAGTGAIYRWEGNKKAGAGAMTILESRPSELICIKLEFLKPFKATNALEFNFKPAGNQTAVTWTMSGENHFLAKAFGLFVNFDKLVGGDFEKGLSKLKSLTDIVANAEI